MKHYQIILAIILVAFGIILIIVAFIVPPTGIIDPTVLTAFGEILTFSGSLIGLDYHYKAKSINDYKPSTINPPEPCVP